MISPNLYSSPPESNRAVAVVGLLLVGNRGGTNVGGSFERGAESIGLPVDVLESKNAMNGSGWLRTVKWHLLGHTPTRLAQFSNAVARRCEDLRPTMLLTTGLAPVNEAALRKIGKMGVCRCNYLTDDPWNSSQRAQWFFAALRQYDHVFTPRRSNISDLQKISDAKVTFMPFGYDPELFFAPQLDPGERAEFTSDLLFAGGADADRVPYIAALRKMGVNVALYGSYWERFRETRSTTRGQIGVNRLRKAIAGCRVALCLVRRANRDGHCMRSFELAAMGACMLVEDTDEHREILGQDGDAAVYFKTIPEMVQRLRWLLDRPEERHRLAAAVQSRITNGQNTYRDRLASMLRVTVQ